MKRILKGIVVTTIDIILFVPRIICWKGGDLLTAISDWERRWYRS